MAIASVRAPREVDEADVLPLEALNIDELLATEYPALQWIIPDILPEGLTLLFSRPKIGKSMFALALTLRMARKVAGGIDGDVLYLSLDDRSKRRLQSRVRDLLAGRKVAGGADFVFNAAALDSGLTTQLAWWLRGHPRTRIIIVDVYAAIKPKKGDSDIFRSDYQTVAALRDFAEQNHIAILLIHHSRKKSDADDWISEINGTTGLAAGVDTLWKLDRKRGSGEMTLHITGRDVEDAALPIDLDDLDGEWHEADPEEDEADPDGKRQGQRPDSGLTEGTILQVLANAGKPLGPTEIAARTGLKVPAVRKACRRMHAKGALVQQTKYGAYEVKGDNIAKGDNISRFPHDVVTFADPGNHAGSGQKVTTSDEKNILADDVVTFSPLPDAHPLKGSRECMGHCLRYVAPEPGEACDRCGHCRWRILEDLYICQQCHPNWMDFISISIMEGGKS